MANNYGIVEKISPLKYSWSLDGANLPDICYSEEFSVCGDKYKFYFRLQKEKTWFCNDNSWKLYLCSYKKFPLMFDARLMLKYSNTSEYISMKNIQYYCFEMNLIHSFGPIRNDISKITCTFSNIQEKINPGIKIVRPNPNVESEELKKKEHLEQLQKSIEETNEKLKHAEQNLKRMKENLELRITELEKTIEELQLIKDNFWGRIQKLEKAKEELQRVNENLKKQLEKYKDGPNNNNGKKDHVNGVTGEEGNVDRCELHAEKDLVIINGDLKNAFLSEEDSDIVLSVGDQKYPAHKVIIKNRSSVFRAMLAHDMKEKNQGVIDIPDCDPKVFREFLLYLYTGSLENISKENMFELYYMSDKYDVIQLKLICIDYIVNNLSIDIICDVIVLATKHSEHDLLKHAINLFIENANDIFLMVKWQEFMKENPVPANELIIKGFNNVSKKQPFSLDIQVS